MATSRNYRREYELHQSSKKEKKNRNKRNRIRRRALKNGIVKKGDKTNLHHVNGINSDSYVVMSESKNKGMPEKSRLPGSKRKTYTRT